MNVRKVNILIASALFFLTMGFFYCISFFVDPQASLDASYYYIMTDQIASGKGFTEPIIWYHLNRYFVDIVRPMDYWMPLGIVLFYLARIFSEAGSEIWINIILWSALVGLVFLETFRITQNRLSSFAASLTMILCGRFVFYLLTTDNFVFYAFLGFYYFNFLAADSNDRLKLPFICGLTALMRIEGIIFASVAGFIRFVRSRSFFELSIFMIILFLTVSPWVLRNHLTLGSLWNSNTAALLIRNYDDFFSEKFPGSFSYFLEQGSSEIIRQRINGLFNSILNLIVVPGQFIFFPLWFIGIGLQWKKSGKPFLLVLLLFILLCGLLFTHQSARGTALHISAFFIPYFSIYFGIGFNALKKRFNIIGKGWLLLFLMTIWSVAFSMFSTNKLIEQYDRDKKPYLKLFNQYVMNAEDLVVSVSPVFVKNISGAGGVISISLEDREIQGMADAYACNYILLDKRIGQQPFQSVDNWKIVASQPELLLYKRSSAAQDPSFKE